GPPRRGGGWLPRVKRAQRAQPVVSGVDLEAAPEGRRRRPARLAPPPRVARPAPLAPPLRLARPALPPPLRGGQSSVPDSHGLRSPSGFAPPVATIRRPFGAEETCGASCASDAPCPPHASFAPPGRTIDRARFPRVALTLRVRSTRGNQPPPLRGGIHIDAAFHGLRSPSGFAAPVATVRRPFGAEETSGASAASAA